MSSHQIAVAKASFSAGLLRPDPSPVSGEEISRFHTELDTMLSHCSPAHIQICKSWLLKHVAPSAVRIGGLGKYFVALAEFLQQKPADKLEVQNGAGRKRGASPRRKTLHILYLLNDLLHHTKYHDPTPTSAFSTVAESLRPYLTTLFSHAGSYSRGDNSKYRKRVDDLIKLWESNAYYSAEYMKKLRDAIENFEAIGDKTTIDGEAHAEQKKTETRNIPYIMPATHGDPNAPYYELPAGNMLPHIIPDSSAAIRTQSLKPLQFAAGPADESLVKAVKSLLAEVDRIYDTNEHESREFTIVDVDELGQTTTRNDMTGESLDSGTYYGWSREFCQNMKQRRSGKTRSRSRSASQSISSRRSASKRRRYSDSMSEDGRGRSPSTSSSLSRARRRRGSESRSRSRSRSPPRRSRAGRSASRSASYSPKPPVSRGVQSPPPPPPPPSQPANQTQAPYVNTQFPFIGAQQLGMLPINPAQPVIFPPPVRPPNYHGPWPPPPPPPPGISAPGGGPFPPAMNINMAMNMGMNMNLPAFQQNLPPSTIGGSMGGQQFMPPLHHQGANFGFNPPPHPHQQQQGHQGEQNHQSQQGQQGQHGQHGQIHPRNSSSSPNGMGRWNQGGWS
ncbi:hypothetical protein MGYG_04204 [Nannizzia gypsea CBS 118893]|uniref:CID domain-containing protein n=1 Tax=Arthroderma gypseum (strain ATCC MYA-4604 / CBS 118893) TaxID=535722 RepID=E4URT0_ARTGP|nr:hypothetical protein MGYG_04204 [Nannizzia gypsea CBS 118893]EFR01202.1 hypothetical protein MGYG_04204 [Nannizzia gypsea CBS 118893]